MNRYIFVEVGDRYPFSMVALVLDSEDPPLTSPPDIKGNWYAVAIDTIVQVGWKADFGDDGWIFSELTDQDYLDVASLGISQRFTSAISWLKNNPVHYKVDIGVATPAEEALWLAYMQFYIAVSEVKNQAGYPHAITWPVAPF